MAKRIYRTAPQVKEMADAHNALRAQIGAGAFFHLDAYENPVASAAATDLPSALTLVNEIKTVVQFHSTDTLAHKVADTTFAALVKAVDLPSAITLANAAKAAYNTHLASTTFHYTADATNTETTADSADLPSLLTLINDFKTKLNAHMASAPATGYALRLESA